MKTTARFLTNYNWLLIVCAAGYGILLVHLSGNLLHYANGVIPYHLLQSQALLEGHYSIGNSLGQLRPGLAWHDGRVQQVWGLGIALWLLPFQALWRLFGGLWFPDRLALALAFALLALYAASTSLRWVRQGRTLLGIGFVWLILFSPPLWTLARASQLVFEETVLYGLILCLGILVAVVRVSFFDSRRDFWICCALGGLSALVRPTLGAYGVGAVIVCCLILYLRHRSLKSLAPGVCILVAGLGFLAVSNQQRFGSFFEFGHRLTVSSETMVYITRFGNPYHRASDLAAARELLAALFLSPPIKNSNAFASGLFPGQAPETRWRRLDLTGLGPVYLALDLIGGFAFCWWSAHRSIKDWHQPEGGLLVALSLWSGISFAALFIFYLHYPSISSRYLLDFLPAMTGFALLLWMLIAGRWRPLAIFALAGWLIYGIANGQVAAPPQMAEQPVADNGTASRDSLKSFAGTYTQSRYPAQTGLALNGSGWDEQSGIADDVVTLALNQPQFVELHLSERRTINGYTNHPDTYRAIMDGRFLKLRQVAYESDGLKVVFDVPVSIRLQHQNQMLFLCFSQGYEAADRDSERFLYSVRWK